MNISQNWDIKYVDEITQELTDEVSIADLDDIEMIFEEYIKYRIPDMELTYRLDDEGDIIVNLPFSFKWNRFKNEFMDQINSLDQDFLDNSSNEYVDAVLLEHAKNTTIQFEDTFFLIGCASIGDEIFDKVAKNLDVDYFTTRQVQVILKKLMNISLSSTERDITSQIRTKIRKAEGIMSELKYHKDLFAPI